MLDRPRLTIEFKHMVLFVHRPNGLTVLLPRRGHRAVVSIKGQSFKVESGVLTLLADGRRLDRRTLRSHPQRLLHFDSVLPEAFSVKPDAELTDVASLRVELGGGRLCEQYPQLLPEYGGYEDVIWAIGAHDQMLTNRATFVLPLETGVSYELQFDSRTGRQLLALDDADTTVAIENDEDTKDNFTGSLEEFRAFYDLFDLKGLDPKDLPVPRMDPFRLALDLALPVKQRQYHQRLIWGRDCSDAPACPEGETEGDPRP